MKRKLRCGADLSSQRRHVFDGLPRLACVINFQLIYGSQCRAIQSRDREKRKLTFWDKNSLANGRFFSMPFYKLPLLSCVNLHVTLVKRQNEEISKFTLEKIFSVIRQYLRSKTSCVVVCGGLSERIRLRFFSFIISSTRFGTFFWLASRFF